MSTRGNRMDLTCSPAIPLTLRRQYKHQEHPGQTMPPVAAGIGAMSISPSGKLLAIGAGRLAFQVFRFNGSSPITKYAGLLHTSETFVEFGWDKDNHLYALSTTNLHVYSATSTSLKEVSGSP